MRSYCVILTASWYHPRREPTHRPARRLLARQSANAQLSRPGQNGVFEIGCHGLADWCIDPPGGVLGLAENRHPNAIGAQAAIFDAVKAQFDGTDTHFAGATLAEGIAVKAPSAANIAIIKQHVTRIDTATEAQIEDAVFDLLSAEKLVAEGAPGAGLAVIKNNLDAYKGKKVGLVICGGNIDSRLLSTLILRGLVRDGRITRLTFEIDDTPGQLATISRIIGEAGANVVEVIHQRMMQSVSLKEAELEIVIEARDIGHVRGIVETLRGQGFRVKTDSGV